MTGQIRTTIGQAQLLIDQRFRQFSGLIDLSEVSSTDKRTYEMSNSLSVVSRVIYFFILLLYIPAG